MSDFFLTLFQTDPLTINWVVGSNLGKPSYGRSTKLPACPQDWAQGGGGT
jgi:hypothetical protein